MSSVIKKLTYALCYLGHPPWDTGVSPPELLAFIHSHPPGRALDMGCGTGTNLVTLEQHGWQVSGIDFSGYAVKRALKRMSLLNLKGQVWKGDVSRQLPVEGFFDLILDIGCYHGLSPAERLGYRENLEIHLAPGGSFLIYAHCQSPESGKATGISQTDIDEFSKLLDVQSIHQTNDRWSRQTSWMLFTRNT
ncbi:MAG: class I SAM-dependent methyltransferase [Anaerolineaceae bacterium]|nr:class I SAM-dependent methyltransferase [Anaerolineaceae bacterium]MBN2676620.1 class I SAM-dependent methyltransferase [Anaerolineaceae bacterium]